MITDNKENSVWPSVSPHCNDEHNVCCAGAGSGRDTALCMSPRDGLQT